jgi:hypothetical protein
LEERLKLVLWVQASITIGGGVKASLKLGPIKLALTPPPMVIEACTHKTSFNPSSNGY